MNRPKAAAKQLQQLRAKCCELPAIAQGTAAFRVNAARVPINSSFQFGGPVMGACTDTRRLTVRLRCQSYSRFAGSQAPDLPFI